MKSNFKQDSSVFNVVSYEFEKCIFTAHYRGVVNGITTDFSETVDFSVIDSDLTPSEPLLRMLSLALSLSYYKATLATHIKVEFKLSHAEENFYRQLLKYGLGEYAFVNQMPWKLTPTVESAGEAVTKVSGRDLTGLQPLVAVGGGKDSIVSIESLKRAGFNPVLFAVGDRGAIRDSVRVSNLRFVSFKRTIDEALIAANKQGAPNGHVPVTAMNSIIALIAAELMNLGAVIFSNEQSANFGNVEWAGIEVNHQWSKSLDFEDLLRNTIADAGISRDSYFSLLRGFRELEITGAFARYSEYFDSFTSCNKAYAIAAENRINGWCGDCPKCLFVFLLLAPYISRARLVEIFGTDILSRMKHKQGLLDILGIGEQKPFECVGEPDEAIEALQMIVANGEWEDSELITELYDSIELAGMLRDINVKAEASVDRIPEAYFAARNIVAGTERV